jgi:hypothetical protein
MKIILKSAAAAGLLALAACGGGADDKAAQNIEDAAENHAAVLEGMADNSSNGTMADQLERRAEQIEEQGERKADAVDRNDGPTTNTGGTTNRVESNVSGM